MILSKIKKVRRRKCKILIEDAFVHGQEVKLGLETKETEPCADAHRALKHAFARGMERTSSPL